MARESHLPNESRKDRVSFYPTPDSDSASSVRTTKSVPEMQTDKSSTEAVDDSQLSNEARMYRSMFEAAKSMYEGRGHGECEAKCLELLTYAYLPRLVRYATFQLLAWCCDLPHAQQYVERADAVCDEMARIELDDDVRAMYLYNAKLKQEIDDELKEAPNPKLHSFGAMAVRPKPIQVLPESSVDLASRMSALMAPESSVGPESHN